MGAEAYRPIFNVAAKALKATGVGGHIGIPHSRRAPSMVRNLASLDLCVVAAKMSRSSSAKAAERAASSRTRGRPTKRRSRRPGASARRPGSAARGGERERPALNTPTEPPGSEEEATKGLPSRRDPPPAKTLAAALALLTRSTGGAEDQPDMDRRGRRARRQESGSGKDQGPSQAGDQKKELSQNDLP